MAKASTPFEQADHEGDDGHDHKDEEQDLGDADGTGSNATKAEDCGDQSDHQKGRFTVHCAQGTERVARCLKYAESYETTRWTSL